MIFLKPCIHSHDHAKFNNKSYNIQLCFITMQWKGGGVNYLVNTRVYCHAYDIILIIRVIHYFIVNTIIVIYQILFYAKSSTHYYFLSLNTTVCNF